MDFKRATDALFQRVTHEDLANKIGVSVPAIRQARLANKAQAHREPPRGWEVAVKALAEKQIQHFHGLLAHLNVPK
jgi:hypothetical protein